MNTRIWSPASNQDAAAEASKERSASDLFVPIGRALFASIFVLSSGAHFDMALIRQAADQGVPLAHLLIPASGVISLLGGMSVLVGYRTKLGAALLALFLVPVTFTMHAFWAAADAQAAQLQTVMFFKNLSLLGGTMLIGYFGAGPYSFDAFHAPMRAPDRVQLDMDYERE
jgi:putative oxidoreductase